MTVDAFRALLSNIDLFVYERSVDENDGTVAALVRRDLLAALETGDAVAELGSREKQKRFCRVASEGLRNLFLLQQGLPDLADLPGDEKPFYEEMAAKLRKNFSRQALAALDRALLLVERNVNQKILFTDLVNRLYMTVL